MFTLNHFLHLLVMVLVQAGIDHGIGWIQRFACLSNLLFCFSRYLVDLGCFLTCFLKGSLALSYCSQVPLTKRRNASNCIEVHRQLGRWTQVGVSCFVDVAQHQRRHTWREEVLFGNQICGLCLLATLEVCCLGVSWFFFVVREFLRVLSSRSLVIVEGQVHGCTLWKEQVNQVNIFCVRRFFFHIIIVHCCQEVQNPQTRMATSGQARAWEFRCFSANWSFFKLRQRHSPRFRRAFFSYRLESQVSEKKSPHLSSYSSVSQDGSERHYQIVRWACLCFEVYNTSLCLKTVVVRRERD